MIKKFSLVSIVLIAVLLFLGSCKNSPSTHVTGTFEGPYLMDSISSGTASAHVVEVNSLTINIGMDFENDPDFTLSNVEVNGSDDVYLLTYTGLEGTLINGIVDHDDMHLTLHTSTDTINFSGVRQ